jgi:hypothetical protein
VTLAEQGLAPALFDAQQGSRDPTGTSQLRASFRADAKLRLRQLRAQMRIALMEQDVLGLGQGTIMGFHPIDVRLNAFHAWIAYMAGHYLAGSWPDRFIDLAWESGRQVAVSEVYSGGNGPPHHPGPPQRLAQLAKQELEGIIAATVQQVSRAANSVLHLRLKPAPAWRVLAAAFDKVTLNRLMALCNVLVIAAFNQAKIDTYRTAGIDQVGIIPETEPEQPKKKAQPFIIGALKTAAVLALAKSVLLPQQQPLAGVQTAGDDRVCDKCDKIAAGSPYTLDKLPIIPAHPNCRCSVYAWN